MAGSYASPSSFMLLDKFKLSGHDISTQQKISEDNKIGTLSNVFTLKKTSNIYQTFTLIVR